MLRLYTYSKHLRQVYKAKSFYKHIRLIQGMHKYYKAPTEANLTNIRIRQYYIFYGNHSIKCSLF